MKYTIALLLMVAPALAAAAPAGADTGPWTNVCVSDPTNLFCADVGKRARNSRGNKFFRAVDIGPIVGVTYKLKGGLISHPGSDYPRQSPRDGYYYIVGPGGVSVDDYFLRDVREIRAIIAP